MAGSAAKKPANDARNSGTSWLMPCTISIATNGTSAKRADLLRAPAQPRHRREHFVDRQFGLERRLVLPAPRRGRSGGRDRRRVPR